MCTDCEARRKLARDAWLRANIGEAAGHLIKGAAEAIGLKPKTGDAELKARNRQKRSTPTK